MSLEIVTRSHRTMREPSLHDRRGDNSDGQGESSRNTITTSNAPVPELPINNDESAGIITENYQNNVGDIHESEIFYAEVRNIDEPMTVRSEVNRGSGDNQINNVPMSQENTLRKMVTEMRNEINQELTQVIRESLTLNDREIGNTQEANPRYGSHESRPRSRNQINDREENRNRTFQRNQHSRDNSRRDRHRNLQESDYDEEESSIVSPSVARHVRDQTSSKLPPFTGREQWKVWFNRFTEVARLKRWDNETKLVELLPRLQGQAGEFVYGQLSHIIRTDYNALIKELNSRFRVVETSRTFGAKFSNRSQKPGEPVEEYAADLKRLYDKAHANRDQETRREDLLRRFLDGLTDDKARFHIEYVKEPLDMDEAVYEVVNFQETKRRPQQYDDGMERRNRRPVRNVGVLNDTDSEDEYEYENESCKERIARAPPRPKKSQAISNTPSQINNQNLDTQVKKDNSIADGNSSNTKDNTTDIQELNTLLKQINDRLIKIENGPNRPPKQLVTQNNQIPDKRSNQWNSNRPNRGTQDVENNRRDWKCFSCLQEGHFSKNCPNKPWNQRTTQGPYNPTYNRNGQSTQPFAHNRSHQTN